MLDTRDISVLILEFLALKEMAPPVASAKLTLTYPLYAADFDPQNNGFLIVGGGGGEGRSGVGNKIVGSRSSIACYALTNSFTRP